jgi:hypothetical protein
VRFVKRKIFSDEVNDCNIYVLVVLTGLWLTPGSLLFSRCLAIRYAFLVAVLPLIVIAAPYTISREIDI